MFVRGSLVGIFCDVYMGCWYNSGLRGYQRFHGWDMLCHLDSTHNARLACKLDYVHVLA